MCYVVLDYACMTFNFSKKKKHGVPFPEDACVVAVCLCLCSPKGLHRERVEQGGEGGRICEEVFAIGDEESK